MRTPKINIRELACFMSHKSIWSHVSKNKLPYALIFEDDVTFTDNISKDIITDCLKKSDDDVDIILLGHCFGSSCKKTVCRGYGKCAHAYIVTNKGSNLLLKNIITNKAIDENINDLCKKALLKCYVTSTDANKPKNVVGDGQFFQLGNDSDIQKSIFNIIYIRNLNKCISSCFNYKFILISFSSCLKKHSPTINTIYFITHSYSFLCFLSKKII